MKCVVLSVCFFLLLGELLPISKIGIEYVFAGQATIQNLPVKISDVEVSDDDESDGEDYYFPRNGKILSRVHLVHLKRTIHLTKENIQGQIDLVRFYYPQNIPADVQLRINQLSAWTPRVDRFISQLHEILKDSWKDDQVMRWAVDRGIFIENQVATKANALRVLLENTK